MFHFSTYQESVTDGPTDRPTDRPTDTPSYRDARTHLKMIFDKCPRIRDIGEAWHGMAWEKKGATRRTKEDGWLTTSGFF